MGVLVIAPSDSDGMDWHLTLLTIMNLLLRRGL